MKKLLLYALLAPVMAMAQATIPFTPACIFNGTYVRCLRSQLDMASAASILTGANDPTVDAVSAPQGSLYLRTGALGGRLYTKQDAGLSTNWSLLAAGGGSVSSVGLSLPGIFSVTGSPVTGAGTLTGSLVGQIANSVWAGPTSGPAAPPTFRLLTNADIPNLSASKITSGKASLTTSTTGVSVSGTDALFAAATVDVQTASGSQPGLLSAADWTAFDAKVSPTRAINTTAPLAGGGNLGADRTLSIPQSSSSVDGYLSATDWVTFNSKASSGAYITDITGDVTATGPGSAMATVVGIQTTSVSSTPPTSGDLLTYNGTSFQWEPAATITGNKTFTGTIAASNFSGSHSGTSSGTNTGDQTITLTSDITGSGTGSITTTLATVNSNVGSFGSSTSIPNFTVNAKGLITAAGGNAVIAPAGTLSGTTLNSSVVTSSLTSVGTIATGVWNGTSVDATHGGTAQSTWTTGDLLYASGSNTLAKLAIGSTNQVLQVVGGVPTWQTSGVSSPVTSSASGVRIEFVQLSSCGASTSFTQLGSWVSSISTRATGKCTINITGGVFSSTPFCLCSTNTAAGQDWCAIQTTSASTTRIDIDVDRHDAADISDGVNVFCFR